MELIYNFEKEEMIELEKEVMVRFQFEVKDKKIVLSWVNQLNLQRLLCKSQENHFEISISASFNRIFSIDK
jgi:hypothetical protein